MYQIVICEDNEMQLHQIIKIVKNYVLFHDENFSFGVGVDNPSDCLDFVNKYKPQNGIYLLDIDLNAAINGMQLAEKIRKMDVQAKLIFITTHDELAPMTLKYQLEALGFISKDQAVEKVRDEIIDNLNLAGARSIAAANDRKQNFSFTVGSRIYNLKLQDVLALVPSEIPHRLKLYTKDGEYEFYGKLSGIAKREPLLLRCSKSALINVDNIISYHIKTRIISFDGGLTCKCSLTKVKELRSRLEGSKSTNTI